MADESHRGNQENQEEEDDVDHYLERTETVALYRLTIVSYYGNVKQT